MFKANRNVELLPLCSPKEMHLCWIPWFSFWEHSFPSFQQATTPWMFPSLCMPCISSMHLAKTHSAFFAFFQLLVMFAQFPSLSPAISSASLFFITYSAGLSGTETTQLHAWCELAFFFLGLLCEDESQFSFSPFKSASLACLHEYCLAFCIEMLTVGCTVKHPNSFGVPKPASESWICCTWISTHRSQCRSEPTMLGHGYDCCMVL